MKNIKRIFLAFIVAIFTVTFCSCGKTSTDSYYSYEVVKAVIDNTCESINALSPNPSEVSQKTKNSEKQIENVSSSSNFDKSKALKIEKNNGAIGNIKIGDSSLSVINGHYFSKTEWHYDVAESVSSLSQLKYYIDNNCYSIFSNMVNFHLGVADRYSGEYDFRFQITSYENQIRINVICIDTDRQIEIQCASLILEFDENYEVTYVYDATRFSGSFSYCIYDVENDKIYYLDSEKENYETTKSKLETELNNLTNSTNYIQDKDDELKNAYLQFISAD